MSGLDQNDWENDPVWNLVDEAKPRQAGPLFVRNVMREVRLMDETPVRWWQQLLTPKPILAGSLGALAVAILIAVNGGPQNEIVEHPQPAPAAITELDDMVAAEMLTQAAEDPTVLTDEALVALLY